MSFYYRLIVSETGKTFAEVKIVNLTRLPIVIKDQNDLVTKVDNILAVKKSNPKADATDLEHEIDQLVYKLYSLTPEEIKIVEGKQ